MTVQFNTTEFEFSHGHKPRSTGRWAFFFDRNAPVEEAFWSHGSYSEAKRAAAKEAQRRGVTVVYVGA